MKNTFFFVYIKKLPFWAKMHKFLGHINNQLYSINFTQLYKSLGGTRAHLEGAKPPLPPLHVALLSACILLTLHLTLSFSLLGQNSLGLSGQHSSLLPRQPHISPRVAPGGARDGGHTLLLSPLSLSLSPSILFLTYTVSACSEWCLQESPRCGCAAYAIASSSPESPCGY